MPSIFAKIIDGSIPCHRVAESDQFLAFLDIHPLKKGHTLVIPKVEIDYIFDLDDQTLAGLMTFSKKVAKGLRQAVPCERIGVAVIGLEVPHAHVHLVPIDHIADLDFGRPKLQFSQGDFEEMAELISQHIS